MKIFKIYTVVDPTNDYLRQCAIYVKKKQWSIFIYQFITRNSIGDMY